jgi:hypothetical protein
MFAVADRQSNGCNIVSAAAAAAPALTLRQVIRSQLLLTRLLLRLLPLVLLLLLVLWLLLFRAGRRRFARAKRPRRGAPERRKHQSHMLRESFARGGLPAFLLAIT